MTSKLLIKELKRKKGTHFHIHYIVLDKIHRNLTSSRILSRMENTSFAKRRSVNKVLISSWKIFLSREWSGEKVHFQCRLARAKHLIGINWWMKRTCLLIRRSLVAIPTHKSGGYIHSKFLMYNNVLEHVTELQTQTINSK